MKLRVYGVYIQTKSKIENDFFLERYFLITDFKHYGNQNTVCGLMFYKDTGKLCSGFEIKEESTKDWVEVGYVYIDEPNSTIKHLNLKLEIKE